MPILAPNEIVKHLQETLPLLTDRFHDTLPVTGGSVSSGIFTIVFPESHGLQPGDRIIVDDAIIRNKIIDVILNADNTVSYLTDTPHDLTAYSSEWHSNKWPDGLSVSVSLPSGTETIELLQDDSAIPHENEFVGVEGSIQPVLTGNEYLLEKRSYGVSGEKEVATVTDEYTITIDLSDAPEVPDGDIIIDHIVANVRVALVADLERAQEVYSSQGADQYYLFLIMLDREVSKDRANSDDFTSLPGSSLKLLNIIQNFSTVVFMPTDDDLGGNEVTTFAYTDLFVILSKCLYGWKETGYTGDGQALYNTSFYNRAYEWQTRHQIDFEDGYINNKSVALRQLNFDQKIFDEGDSSGSIDYR